MCWAAGASACLSLEGGPQPQWWGCRLCTYESKLWCRLLVGPACCTAPRLVAGEVWLHFSSFSCSCNPNVTAFGAGTLPPATCYHSDIVSCRCGLVTPHSFAQQLAVCDQLGHVECAQIHSHTHTHTTHTHNTHTITHTVPT